MFNKNSWYDAHDNKWSWKLLILFKSHIDSYYSPINLTAWWNFGFILGMLLVVQVLTGILLSMHYTADIVSAYDSIGLHIMRDVSYGWLLRYTHANVASLIFFVVYLHMAKALYHSNKVYVWLSGLIIYILFVVIAFLGYILPWGQMSYWGATVITNLFSVIPIIGQDLVFWLWGSFNVGNATLHRFASLHYFLPFLLLVLAGVHLLLLHKNGSSSKEIPSIWGATKINFFPYFWNKDLFFFVLFSYLTIYLVFFNPNLVGHSDNYIPASAMTTPSHIVPEWYFLPLYSILRGIPEKGRGIFTLFAVIVLLGSCSEFVHGSKYWSTIEIEILDDIVYTCFIANLVVLGWLGKQVQEAPYVESSSIYLAAPLLLQITLLFYITYLKQNKVK